MEVEMETEVILAALLTRLAVLFSPSLVETEVLKEELGFGAPWTADGVEFF